MSARHVTLTLTMAQAKGLIRLAGSGEESMDDASWARGHIGNGSQQGAARTGLRVLERAVHSEKKRVELLAKVLTARKTRRGDA